GDIVEAGHRVAQARAVLDRVGAGKIDYAELDAVVGRVELAAGRAQEAEAQLRKAIDALAEASPAPTELAELRDTLGLVLLERKQYDAAREQHELARVLWAEYFGPEHPRVALSRRHLAAVAEAAGNDELALQEYEAAQNIYAQSLGSDCIEVAEVSLAKARVLARLGRGEEALAACGKAIELYRARGSKGLTELASGYELEARIHGEQGQLEEAAGLLAQAVETWERKRGAKGLELVSPLRQLGKVQLELSRATEARKTLDRALDIAADEDVRAWLQLELARAWSTGDDVDLDRARVYAVHARGSFDALGQREAVAEVDALLAALGGKNRR
ncbi:MAG: tetratricopeptide repeat protein, partial [Myxococcales bacterium]|nr:tetratricopeptide repeat protein [Myxococcales bacterium]